MDIRDRKEGEELDRSLISIEIKSIYRFLFKKSSKNLNFGLFNGGYTAHGPREPSVYKSQGPQPQRMKTESETNKKKKKKKKKKKESKKVHGTLIMSQESKPQKDHFQSETTKKAAISKFHTQTHNPSPNLSSSQSLSLLLLIVKIISPKQLILIINNRRIIPSPRRKRPTRSIRSLRPTPAKQTRRAPRQTLNK